MKFDLTCSPLNKAANSSCALVTLLVTFSSLYVLKNKHEIIGHPLFCYIFNSNTRAPPLINSGYLENVKAIVSKDFPSILLNWSRRIGPIFQLKFPHLSIHQPMLVVSGDEELNRKVLIDKTSSKSGLYDVFKFIHDGGDDLFSSEGEYWVHSRKNIALAFSSNHIKRMNAVVGRETKKCMDKLQTYAEKNQPFDVGVEMIDLTLSTICHAAFEYNITVEEKKMFREELSYVLREIERGRIPLRWTFGAWIPSVVRAREGAQKLLAFGARILDSYRTLASPVKGTVIDLIATNMKYKDDKERISDIIVLLIAGHDTTAYTIAWTLILLAKYPEEQNKLQKELQSLAFDERKSSEALHCIMKESMRFQAVTPMGSPRIVNRDINIQKNHKNRLQHDILIPKGSIVICSQILLNYNPEYYDEPYKFKPTRWLTSKEEHAAFMPFGLGKRNCVGQSLAKIEISNVLANICAEFSFEIESEGSIELVLTHQPVRTMLLAKKASISRVS